MMAGKGKGCSAEAKPVDLVKIGRRLAAARRMKGLTIEEASELSGVSQASIGSYEHARRAMSITALVLLLDTYDADANQILGTAPQSYIDDDGNMWQQRFLPRKVAEWPPART